MKPLLTTLVLSFFILPLFAFAQNPNSLVPVSPEGVIISPTDGLVSCEGSFCSACDVVVLANTGIKWLLTLSFLFFAILALRAGAKLITSQGNSGALQDAKQSFTNAFIGLIIILVAWIFVDTLLRQLLDGGTGDVNGYGPWSKVQCAEQRKSTVEAGLFESDPTYTNYHVPEYIAAGGTGGSCSVITEPSNPCNPANLAKYFGARAQEASIICNKESGGKPVSSRSDICCGTDGCQSGEPSFSGGIFQINVIAHYSLIPGCTSGKFFKKNGNDTLQGNCVQRNARGICTGWSCEITDRAMHNTCMQATTNVNLNLQIAAKLYQKNNSFVDWNWSRRICNIP